MRVRRRPDGAREAGVRVAERAVRGAVRVPGDKSISHRAAIVGALADGVSRIHGYSPAGDCAATLGVLSALGVEVLAGDSGEVRIEGRGTAGLRPPESPLDCGRSGTTMRLMAGVLAGASFGSTLTGDEQLLRRPMERVAAPLREMGAEVRTAAGGRPPVVLRAARLRGIEYRLPVASAQVKSAVLLAGLRASGTTAVVEPVPTRDHTERLLARAGLPIRRVEQGAAVRTEVRAGDPVPFELDVPGDLSSAAPLVAAAAIVPGSDLVVENVGLNPTRTAFLQILRRMGAAIDADPVEDPAAGVAAATGDEPRGSLRVRHAPLHATRVTAREVAQAIDELPLLGLVATQAEGLTEVRGAAELRVKESDRIAGLVAGLRILGAEVDELEDGFLVRGPTPLRGGMCDARDDHRLAMTFSLARLVTDGSVRVSGMRFVGDSFPGFERLLGSLR